MPQILEEVQKLAMKKKIPVIRPGQTVRVHQKIKEGEKERIQIFEGLVIKVNSGYGADKTFTVRKIVQGIGVEKVFSVYSPLIEKIEIKKKSKVRRAKLYYMRERSGKSARLKETFVTEEDWEEAVGSLAEQKAKDEAEDEAERSEAESSQEEKGEATKGETAPAPEEVTPELPVDAPTEETSEKKE